MKRFARTTAVLLAAILGRAAICSAATDVEKTAATPAPILSSEISGSDLAFLTGAASRLALLAQLAELAKKQAFTPEVKAEAASVASEQTDAAARLKVLAARMRVTLPEEPDSEGKMVLQTLGKLKGVKFDKSFLDAQADAQAQIETSLHAGADSSDGDIKAFAEAGLRTLKQERERVRKLGL